jgi:hypothetical protein
MCIKVVKSLVFGTIFLTCNDYIKLVTLQNLEGFAVCFGRASLVLEVGGTQKSEIKIYFIFEIL